MLALCLGLFQALTRGHKPMDAVAALTGLTAAGEADGDHESPREPQHCPCYQGWGGALRAPWCLTVRAVAGLPGGGEGTAEAWIVSWSGQAKGKVGTCWM